MARRVIASRGPAGIGFAKRERALRRFGWILGRILLIAVLALVVVGIWQRDAVARLWAVNTLFEEDRITDNFSHMDRAFLTIPLSRGEGPVAPLPAGTPMTPPQGFDDWVEARSVTALVILKDGRVVYEGYFDGTGPDDLRISWSVAKSFLSALFGILLEEGAIASIDDQVVKYAPSLKGSAYEGATIRDVLTMQSGVTFDEDYLDFWSDINKMGRVLALGQSMDAFTQALTARDGAPGTHWQYVSIDTHVIGMVMRGATGKSIAQLMNEKLMPRLGLEAAPYYLSDGHETAFVLGGLNLRTRDYARFGQMVLDDGLWQGSQVVPADWLRAATRPQAKTEPGARQYGYQWWIPPDAPDAPESEVYARGIYGQYIWIDRAQGVVIAANGADRGFREPGAHESMIAMFRKLSELAR